MQFDPTDPALEVPVFACNNFYFNQFLSLASMLTFGLSGIYILLIFGSGKIL
jgi:hypothetical protein